MEMNLRSRQPSFESVFIMLPTGFSSNANPIFRVCLSFIRDPSVSLMLLPCFLNNKSELSSLHTLS